MLRRRGRWLWVLGGAGVAVGAAVAALIVSDLGARGEAMRNGSGDHVPELIVCPATIFGPLVGWLFVWHGLSLWARRPDNRIGALMVAIGCVCPLAVSALARAPALYSLGAAFGNLYIAPTVHLLLALPSGRLQSHGDRLTVAAAYLATLVLLPLAFLFADPARIGCGNCPPNAFLVADEKAVADTLSIAASVVLAGVALALISSLVRRWRRATPVRLSRYSPLRHPRPSPSSVLFFGGALVAFGAATVTPVTGSGSYLTLAIGVVAFMPFFTIPGWCEDECDADAWHGVRVSRQVIEAPETLSAEQISGERNLEVRRVMRERYGTERFLRDAGAELVAEDDFGKLWRAEPEKLNLLLFPGVKSVVVGRGHRG